VVKMGRKTVFILWTVSLGTGKGQCDQSVRGFWYGHGALWGSDVKDCVVAVGQ